VGEDVTGDDGAGDDGAGDDGAGEDGAGDDGAGDDGAGDDGAGDDGIVELVMAGEASDDEVGVLLVVRLGLAVCDGDADADSLMVGVMDDVADGDGLLVDRVTKNTAPDPPFAICSAPTATDICPPGLTTEDTATLSPKESRVCTPSTGTPPPPITDT